MFMRVLFKSKGVGVCPRFFIYYHAETLSKLELGRDQT